VVDYHSDCKDTILTKENVEKEIRECLVRFDTDSESYCRNGQKEGLVAFDTNSESYCQKQQKEVSIENKKALLIGGGSW